MKIPPVKIHFPESDRAEILAKIGETLETGQLTMGKHGRAFEEAFAEFAGDGVTNMIIERLNNYLPYLEKLNVAQL